jgi:2'-5' RNA ligase
MVCLIEPMQEQTYAVVVYLHGPLAHLVNSLRLQLDWEHSGKAAHITILPPRPLVISEEAALEEARAKLAAWYPFEVEVIGVGTFLPVNGVVYLQFGWGHDPLRVLHDTLNQGHLWHQEPFGYVPHITIAQDLDERRTRALIEQVSQEFARHDGPRRFRVETCTFVRQSPAGDWIDLADLQIGQAHVLA